MKLRIKSTYNPAIVRGIKFDRLVAGTIEEVNGEKWPHPYVAVPAGITFEQIEWVRDVPAAKVELKEWKIASSKKGKFYTVRDTASGRRTCDCIGFHYRRNCRHLTEVDV